MQDEWMSKPGPKTRPVLERFMDKVSPEPMSGCWLWTGYTDKGGYGWFILGSRTDGSRHCDHAYRVAYELLIGPIPEGLQLDHKCRVTCCVNPDHLEPVTARTNQLRSTSFTAVNAAKTHCIHGHEFTLENTYYTTNKRRQCRECTLSRQRRYYRDRVG